MIWKTARFLIFKQHSFLVFSGITKLPSTSQTDERPIRVSVNRTTGVDTRRDRKKAELLVYFFLRNNR